MGSDTNAATLNGAPSTLASLAMAKGLPVELFRQQEWSDIRGGGIAIPYFSQDGGTRLFTRERGSCRCNEDKRFHQPAGTKLQPYGLWRLADAPDLPLFITEGETDCLTLWHHGYRAIGLAGSQMAGSLAKEHVEMAGAIYLVPDNDGGGGQFFEKTSARLSEIGYKGKLYRLALPDTVKDVNDLHVRYREAFPAEFAIHIEKAALIRFDRGSGKGNEKEEPEEEPEDDGSLTATLADVAVHLARLEWTWPTWIQKGALSAIASDPGIGKTRLCLDLIRRIRYGLPWPDGQKMTLPWDAPIIYLPCDHQHAEMVQGCNDFGIDPRSVLLNAPPLDPFAGLDLDSIGIQKALSRRIEVRQPVLVIVDTVGNATDANLCRAEEARRFFGELMRLALKYQTSMVLVTHLNASGGTLGRRLDGSARQVIKMERPDPDGQPNRRRLWVAKSNSKYPAPLGITMGDRGNEYDNRPPAKPDDDTPKDGGKLQEAREWLQERLTRGEIRVPDIRREAEGLGYSARTLYRARDMLEVEEFSRPGQRGLWWRLGSEGFPEEEE